MVFEIRWSDGVVHRIPHRILRGYCPCASCQGHRGGIRFIESDRLELREIDTVGNYALSFTFDDGHDSGLYSFEHLRALGELYDEFGDRLPEVHPTLTR